MSSMFDSRVAMWTPEVLEQFEKYRLYWMTNGEASLLTPSRHPRFHKYEPFRESAYAHHDIVGPYTQAPMKDVIATDPQQLLSGNPLAPSDIRPGKFRCWDAAFGIPASGLRKHIPKLMSAIRPARNCNTFWIGEAQEALQRVGAFTGSGEVMRPRCAYLVDYTRDPEGWELLQMAHALAHLTGDNKPRIRKYSKQYGHVAPHFPRWLGELTVARLFDIPLNVTARDDGRPGAPDFPSIGLEVKTSSSFAKPYMRVPWMNREALRPDETFACMLVAIHVEPVPFAFTDNGVLQGHEHWSCLPTMAMVIGWESVDVLTHQGLYVGSMEYECPECYGIHASDLMPPDTFWGYLAWARQAGLIPEEVPGKHMRVDDYLKSQHYHELKMSTPPLPCRECMLINPRTEGAPKRPFDPPEPTPEDARAHPEKYSEWLDHWEEMARLYGILYKATCRHEAVYYVDDTGARNRSARMKFYDERLRGWETRKDIIAGYQKLMKLHARATDPDAKDLTEKMERDYRELKHEFPQFNEGEDECHI